MNDLQIIQNGNGTITTNSLTVSKIFGKRHDHVLRDVRKIISNSPKTFTAPNFGESEYKDETGKSNTLYTLTKNAFVLLAMGFTGEKAMQFKIAYIEAFDKMQNELFGKTEFSIEQDLTLSTVADRNPLDKLVKVWAKQTNQRFNECWRQVNANFNLESVTELPLAWIPDALKFVQERIDNQQKALPQDNKQNMLDTSEFMIDGNLNNKFYTMLQKTYENLSTVYTHVTLYRGHARNVVLSRELSALCNSAEDSVSSALHNLKSAMFNLHNAIRIRSEFEFVNTGHTKRNFGVHHG